MEIERNIQILFEEICPKGYEIINFSKIEGKGLTNFDGIIGYCINPKLEIKIKDRYSKKIYTFEFYYDSYGFLGYIWHLWLDAEKTKFTNILKIQDEQKLRKKIKEYIGDGKFNLTGVILPSS
uniref:Uncharacterized protein n=1 Tax=Clostridium botulinum TaxID=1491 RepID=A0A077K253_CLOBO|nr:hypothetical protein [Clostridium botulinum]BAP25573.1 hypothetical protein [Clostridium botulinum]